MPTLSFDAIQSLFTKIIIRNKGKDPISLAEKLTDALEVIIETSDSGSGLPPLRIERQTATREAGEPEEKGWEPGRTVAASPPVQGTSGLIVLAGDKEFEEAKRAHEVKAIGKPLALSSIGRPASSKMVKTWDYSSLSNFLHANTPEKVLFQPNGTADGTKVLAVRNVLTLQGTDTVRLQYQSPQMGEDSIRAGDEFSGGACSIALVASKTFTLYDPTDIDMEEVMNDIARQLKGLYAPRRKFSAPDSGPEPPPLTLDLDPESMGANEQMRLTGGWRPVENPKASVLDNVVRENRKYGGDQG